MSNNEEAIRKALEQGLTVTSMGPGEYWLTDGYGIELDLEEFKEHGCNLERYERETEVEYESR